MNPILLGAALLIAQPAHESSALIDRELAARWKTEKLTSAEKTSDAEFLRRASIDLIGRIPTRTEQAAYHKDAPQQRRPLLIERLLRHDDFAHHWANVWTDLLLSGTVAVEPRRAFHGWLEQHFAKNGSHKEMVEKLLLAKGTPRDNPAVHYFLALRGQPLPAKEWEVRGQYDMHPLTNQAFRILHAKRIQCVQCHDNPDFEDDLGQHHFHAMNLFFRQVGFKQDAVDDDPSLNVPAVAFYERRNPARFAIVPRFYDQGTWSKKAKETRREFFTERFIKHPDFARAHVNLLWSHFFGHSLNQTPEFDDMTAGNPITYPKILERLAADFVKSEHDSKAILRAICLSDAYALKSVANQSNTASEKAKFFARMIARPMSRHALLESLIVATTDEDYLKRRAELRTEYSSGFRLPESPEVSECEIVPLNPEGDLSLRRAMWVLNDAAISRESSALAAKIVKRTDGASQAGIARVASELFPLTVCRPPTPRELKTLSEPRTIALQRDGKLPTTPAFWTRYAEDILWALINSNEFWLNH